MHLVNWVSALALTSTKLVLDALSGRRLTLPPLPLLPARQPTAPPPDNLPPAQHTHLLPIPLAIPLPARPTRPPSHLPPRQCGRCWQTHKPQPKPTSPPPRRASRFRVMMGRMCCRVMATMDRELAFRKARKLVLHGQLASPSIVAFPAYRASWAISSVGIMILSLQKAHSPAQSLPLRVEVATAGSSIINLLNMQQITTKRTR